MRFLVLLILFGFLPGRNDATELRLAPAKKTVVSFDLPEADKAIETIPSLPLPARLTGEKCSKIGCCVRHLSHDGNAPRYPLFKLTPVLTGSDLLNPVYAGYIPVKLLLIFPQHYFW